MFIDWSQNNGAKTTVSPYSLRGRDRPWVAAPRTWDELDDPDLRQLEYQEVVTRLAALGHPLAAMAPSAERDRLTRYRSMRDPTKTPEPVPAGPTGQHQDGFRFVIQEHHARRLHYDVRLERDGVLASWAVPKAPPTDPTINHLAVRTEDHPLEYLTFHGAIPKGRVRRRKHAGLGHRDVPPPQVARGQGGSGHSFRAARRRAGGCSQVRSDPHRWR